MAHKCGLPYVVPRAHSIPAGLATRSVDNLPHTNTIDALHSESHIKDSMISAQQEQRLIKSEHGSPHIVATSEMDPLNAQVPPLDISGLDEFSAEYNFMPYDGFAPMDNNEQPIFSAGLTAASIDWSLYDGLDFNNDNFATSSYSQAQSFTGFDYSSIDHPTLTTTSTSGEISEVEDFGSIGDSGPGCSILNKQFGSEASDLGDHDSYRLSTASSYIGMQQAHLLASNNMESLSMEEFLKSVNGNNNFDSVINHGLPIDDFTDEHAKFLRDDVSNDLTFQLPISNDNEALWMNDFTHNANNHMGGSPSDTSLDNNWAQ